MRYALFTISAALVLWAPLVFSQPHLDTARKYVGVREVGSNRGPEVEMFLRSVGARPGNSWCAAFGGYCLTAGKAKSPTVRKALARAYVTSKSIKAREVIEGRYTPPPGTIIIWRKGDTIFGHFAFVEFWQKKSGTTVEGNTGPDGGRDGDGVYRKKRTINPYAEFRITDFTEVKYDGR